MTKSRNTSVRPAVHESSAGMISTADYAIDAPRQNRRKQKPLDLPHIPGVRDYEGARNPLTLSNSAQRVSMEAATPAMKGQCQVFHFESVAEHAVALETLLSPDLHHLEVQLPFLTYTGADGKKRKHYFDLRVTFRDGHRRGIFVRNRKSLQRVPIQDDIDCLFKAALEQKFSEDNIVVDADDYIRPYRINLELMWRVSQQADPEAEETVREASRRFSFWTMNDLITRTGLSGGRAMKAIMRLICTGYLGADWFAVINRNSRIWLA